VPDIRDANCDAIFSSGLTEKVGSIPYSALSVDELCPVGYVWLWW